MATWADRNAAARAKGYANYYQYRIHGYGKEPASEPVRGESLARARGHRSQADLLREIGEGDVLSVWRTGPRGKGGRYQWVDMLLQTSDGRERLFRLRGNQIKAANLDKLTTQIGDAGGVVSPAPSLDIRTLIEDDDNQE